MIPAGKLTCMVLVDGWSQEKTERTSDLREWRGTNKWASFPSSLSVHCPVVAVGGVGLWEVIAAVMKDISQKAQIGHRL